MSVKEEVPKNVTKLQVTVVVLYNGTYVVESSKDEQISSLLVVVYLVCFVSNTFLLATVASSSTLKRVPFNLLLANLSVVFLVECVANMSLALAYGMTEQWHQSSCGPSSFFVQLVTLQATFSVTLLCLESAGSVWQPLRFQSHMTVKRQVVATATMWMVGAMLCLPLLFQWIPSRFFPARFGCASAGGGFIHALFLTLWCYFAMPALGLGCIVSLGVRQYNAYRIQRRKPGVNYSDVFVQGDLWTEWVNFKLVAWLSLFYLLLDLPYIVVHQMSSLKTYPKESDNSASAVEWTPKYETVFTWLRYIYSSLFALLVFKMRKDIRQKFRTLIKCYERIHSAGAIVKQETKRNTKADLPLNLNTPVLYISSDGLCVRQLDSNSTYSNPNFISYLCDNAPAESSSFEREEVVPKKCVRFSDTLTIFTPQWVVNDRKTSKIPTRISEWSLGSSPLTCLIENV